MAQRAQNQWILPRVSLADPSVSRLFRSGPPPDLLRLLVDILHSLDRSQRKICVHRPNSPLNFVVNPKKSALSEISFRRGRFADPIIVSQGGILAPIGADRSSAADAGAYV
jgi:hypothetical protein